MRAAIDPRAREQMVAGAEQGEERARGRAHPARQHDRGFGALEHRHPPLHDLSVRCVSVTRIPQPFAGADLLHEVDALEKWRNDGGIGIAFLSAAVHGDGGYAVGSCLSCHAGKDGWVEGRGSGVTATSHGTTFDGPLIPTTRDP